MQFAVSDFDAARCDRYRAVSLFEPWTRFVFGRGRAIIFLSKYTDCRGEMLICSAGPKGQTIGLVDAVDCFPASQMMDDEWSDACAMKSEREKRFKDFALFVENPRRVVEFPAHGPVGEIWDYICPKGELMEYPQIVRLGDEFMRDAAKGQKGRSRGFSRSR